MGAASSSKWSGWSRSGGKNRSSPVGPAGLGIAGLARAQAIADAAHRVDDDRRVAQLLAQVCDVHRHEVGARLEMIPEDLDQDVVAAQQLALAAQEQREQRMLARREPDALAGNRDVELDRIEHQAVV